MSKRNNNTSRFTPAVSFPLGTDGTVITDSATTIIGAIGVNSADNQISTSSVAANEDGSVMERLEQVQEAVNKGSGTALAANKSLVDALGSDGNAVTDAAVSVLGAIGANNANNAFGSGTVVANEDGSVLERLEHLRTLAVTVAGTATAGAAGTITLAVGSSAVNDFYNGQLIVLTGGTGAGQVRAILDYVGATLVATVEPDWATTPDNTSTYSLLPGSELLNAVGANNADNDFDSSAVAANADGSVLERLEALKDAVTAVDDLVDTEVAAIQTDIGDPSARANFSSLETMIGVPDAVNSCLDDMLRTGFDSTAITANGDGSVLERLERLQQTTGVASGTATAGAADSITLAVGSSAVNDFYVGQLIVITGGTGVGQARVIADYVGATLVATVEPDWATAPDNTSVYTLIPNSAALVAIGSNDADNAFDSSAVAANADGSVLERLEAIKDQVTAVDDFIDTEIGVADSATTESLNGKIGTDTELADRSLFDILAGDGPAVFPNAAVPANDVSLAEVLRSVWAGLMGTAAGENGLAAFPAAAAPANDVSLAEVIRAIYDRQLGDGTDASTNTRLGKRVQRAAADIFDGTQKALFTVAGRVLITHLDIVVSVAAMAGGASNTNLISNPTVGTDANMCAVLDIAADEAGTVYSITGNPADAMTGGSGGGAMGMDRGLVVPAGTIDISSAADSGAGGALGAVDLWYLPLTDGATVVTA